MGTKMDSSSSLHLKLYLYTYRTPSLQRKGCSDKHPSEMRPAHFVKHVRSIALNCHSAERTMRTIENGN
eukprot:7645844-Karenia_brevis.AAC.1